jgi:hypothetical protein
MQVGILKVQNEVLTKERNEVVKENEQLYSAIEANTLIMDYVTGLTGAQKTYIKKVQEVMANNGMVYPEFIFEEAGVEYE